MDGYLTKPLEPAALYAELGRWLTSLPAMIDTQTPASETVTAVRALPGFDAANVQRWLDVAPDAWRSMARVFLAEYPAARTAIGTALDAGDRARSGELLHRLRGAAGILGAEDLTAAAERLERAVASDGPVDADLSACFFASADAALAVLSQLQTPSEEQTSAGAAEPGCAEERRRVGELEALLEAGNTRALDHLPWLERWAETQGPGEARELLRQIEGLDFPAELENLRGLGECAFANPRQ
jgi:HPt (histidine-containing phosphotransfer) domain-containing protein